MKTKLFPSCPAILASLLLFALRSSADTVLDFQTITPPQFHNAPIPQSFGDNASSSSAGIVVTGIGTPDIDLTWSATNNPANANTPSTRWDYYSIGGSEDFWRLAQLNQSKVGDYHDLKFTPANSAKVVLKSFNFHGYYGVFVVNTTNVQERFTYTWRVLDGNSLSQLASGNISFLSDATKNHPVNINYTGANGQSLILRLDRTASTLNQSGDPVEVEGDPADIGIDDITFSEETANANPVVTSVSQANGETNVPPAFSYKAVILDGFSKQVNTSTIQLRLDGALLSPSVGKTGLVTTISFSAGGLIRSGSTNKYILTFSDNGGPAANYTNETTFVIQPYNAYEWRFTAGDLSTSLGDATMSYADSGTAQITTFGTTDGGTVPHINGTPAKYMHVPGFTSDIDGYWLTFNQTAPNVGTNDYINRYTLVMDVLIPGPFDADYLVPFFNTDPFNFNDADFYLAGDGSIGIGSGYSATGVIAPNTWYRIAFVADLLGNTLTYYVNGTNVASRAADGIGGRWALYSNKDAGADLLLFNEGDTSGIYTHELYVASVAFADRVLNASELKALGSANANGILARSFNPRPLMSMSSSGNTATVSWPAGYVGYSLEQADNITAPKWAPTPGVTNNAATLNATTTAKFFRLVQ